jgi:2-amino-4-hydroxy-6-hydroxymethyldihydropteridine diphosphokinase
MEIYIGLGSNLGNKKLHLQTAIDEIEKRIGHVVRQSAFIESEPWGFDSSNTFVNAVIAVDTGMLPMEVLKETQAIEREMGRTSKSAGGNYSDRIIDIDILLFGDIQMDTEELTIPHPLMNERDFVLNPLKEIMPADRQSTAASAIPDKT